MVLVFAAVWLWIGASALPMPWSAIAGAVGALGLAAIGWRVLRGWYPTGGRRFDRTRFRITVALEIAAGLFAGWALGRLGLTAYAWPVIGIIVALHFIGLWWATHDPRFLALTLAMLAVNVVALFFPPGAAMLAISGLGSSAALMAAMVRR